MKQVTDRQHQIRDQWTAVYEGAGQALGWIANTRSKSTPRLDSEADSLNLRLRQARNQARTLQRVATRPMTVGFFGLSQAGKSYLISALAAGVDGQLITNYGGQEIDFIAHVNPPGGGKEATGLVTRFSPTAQAGPADFPIELQLFREIELAKLFTNTYFNDFDQTRVDYRLDEDRIRTLLARFEGRDAQAPASSNGVDADNVVELYDYVRNNYRNQVAALETSYWPQVMRLAPVLNSDERAALFSILWGEQDALTQAYRALAQALNALGHAERAYAPLSALVQPDGQGGYRQDGSIMNVDTLERLGTARDTPMQVRPVALSASGEATLGNPVSISTAQLTALTAELTFPLIQAPARAAAQAVDLLDFPGYRGRLKITDMAAAGQDGSNPISQLILRSKVSYLFERYTDDQEMNGLVLCTSGIKQSDVNDVGPVLTRWIEKTQGLDAAERSRRVPGLMWAITMMDRRLEDVVKLPANALPESWSGLIQMCMTERFKQFDWLHQWTPDTPFNNTFLLRKPGMEASFLEEDANHRETGIRTGFEDRLDTAAAAYRDNAAIQRHIGAPVDTWNALMALNDGGLSRLGDHLEKIAPLDFKLERLEEQLHSVLDELVTKKLGSWLHQGGAGAGDQKRLKAEALVTELAPKTPVLSELLHALQPDQQALREIYLNGATEDDTASEQEDGADTSSAAAGQPAGGSPGLSSPFAAPAAGLSSPFAAKPAGLASPFAASATAAPAQAVERQSLDHQYARLVFKSWISHLRQFPQRSVQLHLLGLPKTLVDDLVDEIITAASRLHLEDTLKTVFLQRAQSGTRRDQLAARRALAASLLLGDFLADLGSASLPEDRQPENLWAQGQKAFTPVPEIPSGHLPSLPPQALDQALAFAQRWLSALYAAIIENAGHSAGSEISVVQNTALIQVIGTFPAAGVSHAA
ncbi:virulence factor SrfC family protein [Castellaniella hirudinis]|uniref:Virulence factor SrfC family protein n=1 Tax=Castellaniella hirudinis TaxID=1144617 RepID=A0ABV8RW79_9BURK